MRVVFGLAGGLGNTLFALPTLAALRDGLGHDVIGYVDGDYPDMVRLWRRCRWLTDVVDGRERPVPDGHAFVSAHWCPRQMKGRKDLTWYRWTTEPDYPMPEWRLTFQAAEHLGYRGPIPQVSDWCLCLSPVAWDVQYDVGVVQGSKPGPVWGRKRYAAMPVVIELLRAAGRSVAVFGTAEDPPAPPGAADLRGRFRLHELPEALRTCRVIVGTDSGPTHLAATLGIPTVFVFTATSTIKGAPVGECTSILRTMLPCQPCQSTTRWAACTDWQCQRVLPEDVVWEVERWLATMPEYPPERTRMPPAAAEGER